MRINRTAVVAVAVVVPALILTSCSGNSGALLTSPALGELPAAITGGEELLPAPSVLVAQLDNPPRKASAYSETDIIRNGKEFEGTLPQRHVGISNDDAKFSPDWSETSSPQPENLGIAMYLFDVQDYDRAPEFHYGWSDPPVDIGTAWLGVANFDSDSWEWHRCIATGTATLSAMAPYMSAGDQTMIAFVLANSEVSSLRYVRLGPHVVSAQLSATGQGIVPFTATYNAGGSSTAVGTLDLFEWDFDGDGTYDTDTGATSLTTSNITDTGVYHPVVRVTSSYGVSDTATDTITAVISWTTTWGRQNTDSLSAIQWDGDGNIYAIGQSSDGGAPQLLLMKFAPYGEPLWAKSWAINSSARGDSGSFGIEIRMAGDGGLYVLGGYGTPEGNTPRLLLQKWSTAGELLFSKSWGNTTGSTTSASTLLQVSGELYIVGFTDEFSGNNDIALFKLSADGEIDWLKTYGGTDDDGARDAAVTGLLMPTGIAVAGPTRSFGALESDILLVKFDLTGNVTLEQRWNMAGLQFANALYLEPSEELYLTGYTLNTADDAEVLLLGVNGIGTEIFKETWGTTGYDRALGIRRVGGETYICGEGYISPGDSWYALLLQLDSSGDEVAAATWRAAGDPNDSLVRMYFYAGGQLLCGQADNANGAWTVINGSVDKTPAGSWLAVSGTVTDQVAGMSNADGTVTDLGDTGVLNTGAGEEDALLMLTEFP